MHMIAYITSHMRGSSTVSFWQVCDTHLWFFHVALVCAIVAGSGKSTLLNTMALRLDKGVTQSGELKLNGREYDIAELKRMR
jgi:ABC-type arginine transport system ATPase subunit